MKINWSFENSIYSASFGALELKISPRTFLFKGRDVTVQVLHFNSRQIGGNFNTPDQAKAAASVYLEAIAKAINEA